ncbi:MAG: hypothetical protein Q7I99_03880 [Acholeplasmataceae bacterium]|nr:hypothetical protein [Acholeplasmataceae bacterium]
MDALVFKKMRVKPGTPGVFFYAPLAYQEMVKNQDYVDFTSLKKPKFIHLFVESEKEYKERINEALSIMDFDARLWISYKKSTNKVKYDINRDSFFIFAKEDGLIPNANISLDQEWSCVGFKKS